MRPNRPSDLRKSLDIGSIAKVNSQHSRYHSKSRGLNSTMATKAASGAVSERLYDDSIRRKLNYKMKIDFEISKENQAIAKRKMSKKSKEINNQFK